jgi:sulfatase modifying factor 1
LEKQILLKRNDNLSIDLFPNTATGSIQLAVTPFDAEIEITGDAGEHYTAKGMHIFRDIPVGQYTLKVKAEGFRNETKTLKLNANQVLNQSIKLEEGVSGDIEMILVKGGTFQMGSNNGEDNEKPVHTVTVNDFYIGKYEVTQKQWANIMGNNPSKLARCDDCPVLNVSWNVVLEFIKKLNQETGMNYRLPTEAEWEYVARGGVSASSTTYFGSNTIEDVAWYSSNSGSKVHKVGTKKANELGIYDLCGNVWELCNDEWDSDYYKNSPQNNPQNTLSRGNSRVVRGGAWNMPAKFCRVTTRGITGTEGSHNMGFRLALPSR